MHLAFAKIEDIPSFVEFESSGDTSRFVSCYAFERHIEEMNNPTVQYLSITVDNMLVGFIILSLEPDNKSIEFRRIVINSKGKGFGQKAIHLMEEFCKSHYNVERIWLDVYEDNHRAQHVYKKSGYTQFGAEEYNNRKLLLFEKQL